MQSTTNYNLNKPENTDEIKISDLNENFDKIDTELKNANNEIDGLNENKVSTTGDVSDTIVTEYTTTQTSFPTLSVGEKLKVVFGKINKFISDVKNWKTTVDENLETNTTAIETLNSDLNIEGVTAGEKFLSYSTLHKFGNLYVLDLLVVANSGYSLNDIVVNLPVTIKNAAGRYIAGNNGEAMQLFASGTQVTAQNEVSTPGTYGGLIIFTAN